MHRTISLAIREAHMATAKLIHFRLSGSAVKICSMDGTMMPLSIIETSGDLWKLTCPDCIRIVRRAGAFKRKG
jgi:hypothetical protein